MKELHRGEGQTNGGTHFLGSFIYSTELERSQGWRWAFLREGTPECRIPWSDEDIGFLDPSTST